MIGVGGGRHLPRKLAGNFPTGQSNSEDTWWFWAGGWNGKRRKSRRGRGSSRMKLRIRAIVFFR